MSPIRVIALPFRALSIIACTALLALVLAGCSGGASQGQAVSQSVESQATPGTPLTETATDNRFGTTKYTIVAGQTYTLTLTNSGSAVHNWHIVGLKEPDGKPVGTPLREGGKTSTVTFAIGKPGSYRFQCDVHPTEMTGTIVVN